MRDALDSLVPHLLVELRVEPNLFCPHVLLSERDDGLDCPWCSLLERPAVHVFVEMDGVFTGHDVLQRRSLGGLENHDSTEVVARRDRREC